jgi:DVNP family
MTHEMDTVGTRAKVWHGTAKHTSGMLEKKDLIMNKRGRIVSRLKHFSSKRENRLSDFKTKKGEFGLFRPDGSCQGRTLKSCRENNKTCTIARGKHVKAYCRKR